MARPRSDIQLRILRAARARFLREGVDGASLRAIAADAATSIGMVYYYFRSKDALFLAVVEVPYAELLDELTRELDTARPPRDRIRALYRRVGRVTAQEAEIMRLVVREALGSSARLASILARFRRGHIPLVLRAIADGMREGTIRSDVSPLLLLPVIAAVGAIPQLMLPQLAAGQRALGRRAPGRPATDLGSTELAERLLELLYSGIASSKTPRTVRSPRRPRARDRERGPRRLQ